MHVPTSRDVGMCPSLFYVMFHLEQRHSSMVHESTHIPLLSYFMSGPLVVSLELYICGTAVSFSFGLLPYRVSG